MRLDTSSPVLYTSASIAEVQHPKLPRLLLLFLQLHAMKLFQARYKVAFLTLLLCQHCYWVDSNALTVTALNTA